MHGHSATDTCISLTTVFHTFRHIKKNSPQRRSVAASGSGSAAAVAGAIDTYRVEMTAQRIRFGDRHWHRVSSAGTRTSSAGRLTGRGGAGRGGAGQSQGRSDQIRAVLPSDGNPIRARIRGYKHSRLQERLDVTRVCFLEFAKVSTKTYIDTKRSSLVIKPAKLKIDATHKQARNG